MTDDEQNEYHYRVPLHSRSMEEYTKEGSGNESSVCHAIDSFVAQPNGVETTRGHEDSHDNPSTNISENLVNSPSTDAMNP